MCKRSDNTGRILDEECRKNIERLQKFTRDINEKIRGADDAVLDLEAEAKRLVRENHRDRAAFVIARKKILQRQLKDYEYRMHVLFVLVQHLQEAQMNMAMVKEMQDATSVTARMLERASPLEYQRVFQSMEKNGENLQDICGYFNDHWEGQQFELGDMRAEIDAIDDRPPVPPMPFEASIPEPMVDDCEPGWLG